MTLTRTKHSTYGRVRVSTEDLNNDLPFVQMTMETPRDTVAEQKVYTVGKAALDDKGGYVVPKGRASASRVEMYLPLVNKCVSLLKRPEDDWDELYAVGSLALVEADAKFSQNSNYAFASYAKPYIMGFIKNHINPTRNGDMNMLPLVEGFDVPAESTDQYDDIWRAFYSALGDMTKKQQQVMKLLYIEGHTQQNAADILGVKQQSLEGIRNKAVRHIRKRLGETVA
jgi:RNA polymerase sigma factor (sigma-70 family)